MVARRFVLMVSVVAALMAGSVQAQTKPPDARERLMRQAGLYVPYDFEQIVQGMPSPPASVPRGGRCKDSAPRYAQVDGWETWQLQPNRLASTLGLWALRHFGSRAAENLVGGCADYDFMISAWQAALGNPIFGVLRPQEVDLLFRFRRGEVDVGKDPAGAQALLARQRANLGGGVPLVMPEVERARKLLVLHHQLPPRSDEVDAVLTLPKSGPVNALEAPGCRNNGPTFEGQAARDSWAKRPHGHRMFMFWASYRIGASAVLSDYNQGCLDMQGITRQWQALNGRPVTGVLTAEDIDRMRAAWTASMARCTDFFASHRQSNGAAGGFDLSILNGAFDKAETDAAASGAGCVWNESARTLSCASGTTFAGVPLQAADIVFDQSMSLERLVVKPVAGQQDRLQSVWSSGLGSPEIEIFDVAGSMTVERRRLERTDLMPWGRGLAEVDVISVQRENMPVYRQRRVLHWKSDMFTGKAEEVFVLSPRACRR